MDNLPQEPEYERSEQAKREAERRAFERFLYTLGPDLEKAGKIFTDLHNRLVIFAETRKHPDPEGFADKVLSVLQRKTEIENVKNPQAFAYGIAQKLHMAEWRNRPKAPVSISEMPDGTEPAAPPAEVLEDRLYELRHDCLMRCLEKLSASDREIIFHYYRLDDASNKSHIARKSFASRLNIRSKTLAVQVHRIKKKQLTPCIEDCRKNAVP